MISPSYQSGFAKNAAQSQAPGLWRGLVGAWVPAFGSTGDMMRDVSGRGNHGTLESMDPSTDWIISNGQHALDIDSDDDYVNIANSRVVNEITKTITVECWITVTSTNQVYVVSSWETTSTRKFHLGHSHFTAGGALFAISLNGSAHYNTGEPTKKMLAGEIHHLVGQYDGFSMKIYLDGILGAETAQAGSLYVNTAVPIWFVKNLGNFEGVKLHKVSIYNRLLSEREIFQLSLDPLRIFRIKKLTTALPFDAPSPAVERVFFPALIGC